MDAKVGEAKDQADDQPPLHGKHQNLDGDEDEDEDEDEYDDEDEDEDDEEEESDEEDLDGEEPVLKYQRLRADVTNILKKDAIACFAAHEKFLVIGTRKGSIHLLDLNGNEIVKLNTHSGPINYLSLDPSGDYVASCADDGQVIVTNLFSRQAKQYKFNQPMSCVCLSPTYSQKPMFVAGGPKGELYFNQKSFFGDSSRLLQKGEGPVGTVSWHSNYIAWSNDYGVKAIHAASRTPIAFVPLPADAMDTKTCRCSIVWSDNTTMLVGRGDCVQVCKVQTMGKREVMKITAAFRTEYTICGISPFSLDEQIVTNLTGHDRKKLSIGILAYPTKDESSNGEEGGGGFQDRKGEVASSLRKSSLRPEMLVVTAANEDISWDSLPVEGCHNCNVLDFWLSTTVGPEDEALYYIVSPGDIVVARPCDWDDHVTWLINHGDYEEALEAAESNQKRLKKNNIFDIRENYLEHLVERRQYQKAASFCPRLLKDNENLWENWVYFFAEKKQLTTIVPYIPVKEPRLSPRIYDLVLNHLIHTDPKLLLHYLHIWPQGIYTMQATITAVIDRLNQKVSDQSPDLMRVLGELYIVDKQFDKAVQVYLQLKSDEVFTYVRNLDLFTHVKGCVLQMMQLDAEKTIELLMENLHQFTIREVVEQLDDTPQLLHKFLHALFEKDQHTGAEFHNRQVDLYAQYDPVLLLNFLKNSNFYDLEEALKLCKARKMHNEMVFILNRMGSTSDALMIIIYRLQDVKRAIEFVENSNDDELWEVLIKHSLESKLFLSDLLGHVGDHYVDSLKLVTQIPEEKEIPMLKQKIMNIFTDKQLQISVQEGCVGILEKDCIKLHASHADLSRGGISVDTFALCCHCKRHVVGTLRPEGIYVCMDGTVSHGSCARKHDESKASELKAREAASARAAAVEAAAEDHSRREDRRRRIGNANYA